MRRPFPLSALVALSAAALAGAADAACPAQALSRSQPIEAPKLVPGTRWSYAVGKEFPNSTLQLLRADAHRAEYEVNGKLPLVENPDTYSDVNPLRQGTKVLIRFPLQLGDTWTDEFSEEGEYTNRYEHYYYDYQESSRSKAAAIERITVAAGTFQAIRIDRVAYWAKTRPRAAEGDDASREPAPDNLKVTGATLTQLWYVPSLGRAVLKASLRVGDAFYAQAAEDLLRNAKSSVVELAGYDSGDSHCANKPVLLAGQPEQYLPLGYAVVANDTWEWAFKMREHHPRRTPQN
jgi:hypothetical protein